MQPPYSDKENLEKIFRRELEHHQVTPSSKVWNRIAESQKHSSIKNRFIRFSIVTVLVFGLGMLGHMVIKQDHLNHQLNISFSNQLHQQKIELPVIESPKSDAKNFLQFVQKKNRNIAADTLQKLFAIVNYQFNERENNSENISHAEINQLPALNHFPDFKNNELLNNPELIKQIRNQFIDLKGWYAGVDLKTYASYLLDNDALNNQAFRYDLHPGFSTGLNIGYHFSNSFAVQSGLNVFASEGQDYFFIPYTAARTNFQHREIDLHYVQVPVECKYMISKLNAHRNAEVLNLNAGLQLSHLTSSTFKINGDVDDISGAFKKNDLAVTGGFDYDIYLNNKSFITFGLAAAYGGNLFSKNYSDNLDEFSAPHNFIFGINAAYNFMMK